jgi:hypothetical protein
VGVRSSVYDYLVDTQDLFSEGAMQVNQARRSSKWRKVDH